MEIRIGIGIGIEKMRGALGRSSNDLIPVHSSFNLQTRYTTTAHSAQRTAHSAQRTAHSAQRTAHSAQRTAHSAQRTAHSAQRRE
jgi:hypothetical protein